MGGHLVVNLRLLGCLLGKPSTWSDRGSLEVHPPPVGWYSVGIEHRVSDSLDGLIVAHSSAT
jgi:hypothetical protein